MKNFDRTDVEIAHGFAELKKKYNDLLMAYELRGDFITWLFETELDYTTHDEMWEKFEKLNESENGIQ